MYWRHILKGIFIRKIMGDDDDGNDYVIGYQVLFLWLYVERFYAIIGDLAPRSVKSQ